MSRLLFTVNIFFLIFSAWATAEETPTQSNTKSASLPWLFFFTIDGISSLAFIVTSAPIFFANFNRFSLMSVANIFLAFIAFASFICKSPAIPHPRTRILCSGFISATRKPRTTQANGSIKAPSSYDTFLGRRKVPFLTLIFGTLRNSAKPPG